MAHELSITENGVEAFYTKEPPWHRLGTIVEEAPNSKEAIRLAHLDWRVSLYPLVADINGNKEHSIPNRFATVREDNHSVLGVVGSRYRVIQNDEAFLFMDEIIGKDMMYESAGALRRGESVWMLAKFPDEFAVSSDDIVYNYILLVNSHNGTSPIWVIPTNVRVVCWNTLQAARRTATGFLNIRHTGNIKSKLEDARLFLKLARTDIDKMNYHMKVLSKKNVTVDKVKQFIEQMFTMPVVENSQIEREVSARLQKTREMIKSNFDSMNTIASKGTAYGLLNSVTEYVDHQRNTYGRGTDQKLENRFRSSILGSGVEIKRKAMKIALTI
jgi:phage/plasmid-like protein (TIGR03299 family)